MQIKGKGSIVSDCEIGEGTVIWHYCNLYGCKIGKNCKIASYVEIGKDVVIGDNCKIEAFTFIPSGVKIGNRVFIGPHVCFINDKWPKATGEWEICETIVEDDVSIGANSTILAGVTIGKGAMIGAGSVVTRDVPANAVIYGEKAKVRRRL